ncbi:DUF1257 domain-containing protein [Candidatus Laterigemmans baculatus]|uniref:DUF1257 domain-containing protein n=1 Tax=Candidatus Laterigemmans baculatus TaxID=2770505 RepID=UPI0013DC779D|nr:DUF1257 domain-containing protein [Candidatus Laterigemmans baculatus]
MSHVVRIRTEVRDLAALRLATARLSVPSPQYGKVRLFSSEQTGWSVPLTNWRYPVVFDTGSGEAHFDNYQGRWGEQRYLDQLLQAYAVEKAKVEARKQGHSVSEQTLGDGSIKLTVQVGGAA